jgi:hypothetical protein
MKCIRNFVRNVVIVQIVVEYDIKIVCFLLLQMHNQLNLIRVATKLVRTKEDLIFFLGQVVSTNDVIFSTLKNEL